jgi:hypothetical protein
MSLSLLFRYRSFCQVLLVLLEFDGEDFTVDQHKKKFPMERARNTRESFTTMSICIKVLELRSHPERAMCSMALIGQDRIFRKHCAFL